ncbi:hypothetical protein [Sutcliffiella cohnii]|uniref:hypothetical protein n=1 Tax=Sutcliffiella cohnii TaxID=33932 RepID=UPI002E1A31DF|nr:hypothetical protein [Sutcliffiella cohnii]
MLFHYHFWTPYVEETEKFYKDLGFVVTLRTGKYEGEFQAFHPPLTWDDFRGKKILFRIIEMRKGSINITFGFGKKVKFDHIGFLISEEDHESFCTRAKQLNWDVNVGERRTFLSTPYGFKVELQTDSSVIEGGNIRLKHIQIGTTKKGLEQDLYTIFQKPMNCIRSSQSKELLMKEAVFDGVANLKIVDPNGVRLLGMLDEYDKK